MTDYLVIYEQGDDHWSAYVPDLPGCTAAGITMEDVQTTTTEAVELHVGLLRDKGQTVPEPSAVGSSSVSIRA